MARVEVVFARLATKGDEEQIVAMAPAAVAESFPHLNYCEERWRNTFQVYLETSEIVFFVAEENREVVGFNVIAWGESAFSDSLFAEQRVIYVKPEKRGTRAAAELVMAYSQWAERLGITDVDIHLANGRRTKQIVRYMRQFGFESVGAALRKNRALR